MIETILSTMFIRKVAILLILFIFGITAPVWADPVKSINNAANQETGIKMDENKVAILKKTESVKEPIQSLKKRKARSLSDTDIPYSDYGAIMGNAKLDVNFLKTLEKQKRPLLLDSLRKMIYSYGFPQNGCRENFLNFIGVAESKSSNQYFNQPVLRSYPTGNKYFEDGRILETFKLLQFKREEIFKEIFMGFRFSFNPISGHMFLAMNVTPSSEKVTGFIIPF